MTEMALRVVFLAGSDSASTRASIAAVCRLEGVEPVAILLDTARPSFSRRYKNLRRNMRRNGASFIWHRALAAASNMVGAAVENIFPSKDTKRVLKRAFPEECFDFGDLAGRYGLKIIEAGNLNSSFAAETLASLHADLGIVLGTRVLRRGTFGLPKLGSINLHKGAVPQYRGMPPGFWELFNSETAAGVTVHNVDDSLDTGAVIAQSQVAISPLDTPETLLNKLHAAGHRTLAEAVSKLRDGTTAPRAQAKGDHKAYTAPTRKQLAELRRRLPHWCPPSPMRELLKNVWILAIYYSGVFALARFYHRIRDNRGAVILYHRVNDLASPQDALTTNRERFAGHMLMLARWYKLIGTRNLVRSLREGSSLPATSVAVHFDDCYRDVYQNACPIMKSCGVTGTAFVSSGFVDTDLVFAHDRQKSPFHFENLTARELTYMLEGGFEIGAHTVNHVDLGSIPIPQAEFEIAESVRALTRITGNPITHFSFPFGREANIREELRGAVRNAGCDCIFSAYGGFVGPATDLYDIPRFGTSSMHSPLALALELEGLTLRAISGWLRGRPKVQARRSKRVAGEVPAAAGGR